ncbi:unnamed protein product [Caenorhabditis auriculariae]|uniref:Uncharacterized protein n=1 Tax=Caenorhabditis auriculariae TaxID=2777116 RepID=A0A8S1GU14_9PELO|nr:unnamed protein product [Caenorhabditis auriculariae]
MEGKDERTVPQKDRMYPNNSNGYVTGQGRSAATDTVFGLQLRYPLYSELVKPQLDGLSADKRCEGP